MLDTYSILSDNYQAGVLCAEQLISVRDEDRIILPEHVSASSGVERIQGFRDALAGRKGVTVLASGESDGHTENAMPVMEALLRQAPEADLLMALNGPRAFSGLAGGGRLRKSSAYGTCGSGWSRWGLIDLWEPGGAGGGSMIRVLISWTARSCSGRA